MGDRGAEDRLAGPGEAALERPPAVPPQDRAAGRPAVRRVAAHGLAATAVLLFGLGFGLNFGVSNQNTYLVGAVRQVDPSALARDWFTTQTTPYHRVFTYPAAALLALDSSGWLFAAVNVLLVAVGAAAILKLVRAVTSPAARPLGFLLVLLPAIATRTLSVGDSLLYGPGLEPATLGVTGFLLGMYLFVRQRHLWSGLAVALGGLFHANYLLLSIPVFVAAHLLVRRRGVLRPLLLQIGLPIVAMAALSPVMIPVAWDPGSAGTDILLSIRSPHHYQPLTFRDQFLPLLGWILVGAAMLRPGEARRWRLAPLAALAAAMTVIIGLGTALTTVVYLPSAAQAYVWRLAPLVVVIGQIHTMRAVAEGVIGRAATPAPPRPQAPLGRGRAAAARTEPATESGVPAPRLWLLPGFWRGVLCAVASLCFLQYYYLRHRDGLVLGVLGGLLLLALVGQASPWWKVARAGGSTGRRWRPAGAKTALVLAAVALVVMSAYSLRDRSNLLPGETPESNLYSWARSGTDPAALFLIPPDLDDFRLSARRAVVVDWKSTPFRPGELEEWYRRIETVSGRTQPRSAAQAVAGYAALSGDGLANVATEFGVQYLVRRTPATDRPPDGWQVVFRNEGYEVLETDILPYSIN